MPKVDTKSSKTWGSRGATLPLLLLMAQPAGAALEVYSGVDPNPESAPVVEGAVFAPEEVDVPAPAEMAPPERVEAPRLKAAAPTAPARTPAPKAATPTASARTPAPKAATPTASAPAPAPRAAATKPRPAPQPEVRVAPSSQQGPAYSERSAQKELARLRVQVAQLRAELERQKAANGAFPSEPEPECEAKGTFDPVPSDQAEAIARRLGIVARLILNHGRAYDYRSMTTRELQDILNRLELAEGRRAAQSR